MHTCTISLTAFEGPLDLLLHLVEQAKLDITQISLVQVTGQYLAHMRAEDRIDHRALADFVSIGARLIELKSRALLPVPPQPPVVDQEPDPDDLVAMLLEYQRFKDAASQLREREEEGVRAFPRLALSPEVPVPPGLSHMTLDRLAGIVQKALARTAPVREPAPIRRQVHSVRQKIAEIKLVLRINGHLSFSALLQSCRSREEIIVAFFAVLELIKSCSLVASQDQRFGDIDLSRVEPNTVLEDEAEAVSEPELARV